jgi:hypothetical protein
MTGQLQRVWFQIPAACVNRLELDGDTCHIEEGVLVTSMVQGYSK